MRFVCWQTILMKYHTLFFRKLGKMSQNLSSAAVVIGALRVSVKTRIRKKYRKQLTILPNHWVGIPAILIHILECPHPPINFLWESQFRGRDLLKDCRRLHAQPGPGTAWHHSIKKVAICPVPRVKSGNVGHQVNSYSDLVCFIF